MPNQKRTIPVSEVKPGDSIRLCTGQTFRVVNAWQTRAGGTGLTWVDDRNVGHFVADFAIDASTPVTVGYTNRKAKRARGKMARRARFAERDAALGESVIRASASWCDEIGG